MAFDLSILEYDKILKQLRRYAESDVGKAAAQKVRPFEDEETLNTVLGEVREASMMVAADLSPSFGGVHTIDYILKRTSIGAIVDSKEFLKIHAQLDAIPRIKRHLSKAEDALETALSITHYTEALDPVKPLKKEIESIIDTRGNIRDDASRKLRDIRSNLAATKRKIQETLEGLTNSQSDRLTEKLYTVRYDRYVLPVKLSDKNNVKGTVVDYSSSGETVFVEPSSIRALSAKKTTLQTDEEKEVERILYALGQQVAAYKDALEENTRLLSLLDLLFAKAKYGYAMEASVPQIKAGVNLISARHPLIDPSDVVANTITFDEGVRQMVITGSNTGGKTVTLKTLGLLSLMAQSGMMIPALPGSHIQMFEGIRADIGDEQSIEQSLSTFSSHMSRIVDIINNFSANQLILLDELGSGTDPKEGSSLAMSILDYLAEKDAYVVATTHYPELKAYAYTNDHVMNASVEFDENTLKPTYKLRLRTPGESHAFLISRRLGLDETIINRAKENVVTEQDEVSELIENLKQQSEIMEHSLKEYAALNRDLANEKQTLSEEKQKLQKKRETLKETLTTENAKTMQALKQQAQNLIDELSQMKNKQFKEHELAQKKHSIKQLTPEDSVSNEKEETVQDLTKGDQVYIKPFNRYGEIIKKQRDGRYVVAMGTLQSVFESDALELSKQTKTEAPKPTQTQKAPSKSVSETLDLRGMRVHEAKDTLEKYLDDCALSKQPYATIIHGFGTMALRNMVKEVLKNNKTITHHRDGGSGEGGQGATVVYFE